MKNVYIFFLSLHLRVAFVSFYIADANDRINLFKVKKL